MAALKGGGAAATTMMAMLLCSALFLRSVSAATVTVGQRTPNFGWVLQPSATDFDRDLAGENLVVGDVLLFPYVAPAHNVYVVSQSQLANCDGTSPNATYVTTNSTVTLDRPGYWGFICEIPTHCTSGNMHLAVNVSAAAVAAPAPSPIIIPVPVPVPVPATPPPAPAPAPVLPAPAPAPATVITPAPTPTTAPTPGPATPPPAAPGPSPPSPPSPPGAGGEVPAGSPGSTPGSPGSTPEGPSGGSGATGLFSGPAALVATALAAGCAILLA